MKQKITKQILFLTILSVSTGIYAQNSVHNGIGYNYAQEQLSTENNQENTDTTYNKLPEGTRDSVSVPVLLKHDEMISKYNNEIVPDAYYAYSNVIRTDVFALASDYDAAPISNVLWDLANDVNYAEGQVFYLEGGKTYYLDGQNNIVKGFTLATNPEDVAKGLRAKVICGIGKNTTLYPSNTNGEQWQGSYSMFMFGRQPEVDETYDIEIGKIEFRDIDFDNPKALNYGDNAAGAGTVAGNYFFNMYSNGMAVTLDSLVIDNCSFKRLVRGFIREQGANYKVWNHVLIHNNLFYDCGYYNQRAGGYPWIAGSGNNAASNLYKDMQVTENTFYDSPFPSLFSETSQSEWTSGAWNITFSNNTLINLNTRASGVIFNMRYLPDGSVYNVKNNLLVLTKKEGDQRVLGFWGADIRSTMTLSDGTEGKVTLNFENNWSTSDNLTNGSIFSGSAWSSTSNNFGKLVMNGSATLNGSLDVNVANISSTDLFYSPCPPHVALTANDQNMHRADALDGTATTEYNVNLYYKNLDNDIVKNKVGADRWMHYDAAINNTLASSNETTMSFDGKKVYISNPEKDSNITVYTADGVLYSSYKARSEQFTIDTTLYPSGLYIIKSNNAAFKFKK